MKQLKQVQKTLVKVPAKLTQVASKVSEHVVNIPDMVPSKWRPVYDSIAGSDIEKSRKKLENTHDELNRLRTQKNNLQPKLRQLNKQYHDIGDKRSNVLKSDKKYTEFCNEENRLAVEIESIETEIEILNKREDIKQDELTQAMKCYHLSDNEYRNKIRSFSYVYGIAWIIAGVFIGFYTKNKFNQENINNVKFAITESLNHENNINNFKSAVVEALNQHNSSNDKDDNNDNQLIQQWTVKLDQISNKILENQQLLIDRQTQFTENFGNFSDKMAHVERMQQMILQPSQMSQEVTTLPENTQNENKPTMQYTYFAIGGVLITIGYLLGMLGNSR